MAIFSQLYVFYYPMINWPKTMTTHTQNYKNVILQLQKTDDHHLHHHPQISVYKYQNKKLSTP